MKYTYTKISQRAHKVAQTKCKMRESGRNRTHYTVCAQCQWHWMECQVQVATRELRAPAAVPGRETRHSRYLSIVSRKGTPTRCAPDKKRRAYLRVITRTSSTYPIPHDLALTGTARSLSLMRHDAIHDRAFGRSHSTHHIQSTEPATPRSHGGKELRVVFD